MNQAPSYEELKDSECFWLQLTPYVAGMNETLDGSLEDEPLSSFLYYEVKRTEVEDGFDFPYKDLRINVWERSGDEILSLSGKYPLGFIRFHEDSTSIRLMCRSELVSRMVSTLGLVKDNEIDFLVTVPVIASPLPYIYPILSYQYRVNTSSKRVNA